MDLVQETEDGFDVKWKNSQVFKDPPSTILKVNNPEYLKPSYYNWIRNNGTEEKPALANFPFNLKPIEKEKQAFVAAFYIYPNCCCFGKRLVLS